MCTIKAVVLCVIIMIISINGQCSNTLTLIDQIFNNYVNPLLNSLSSNTAGYDTLINQLSKLVTSSELTNFKELTACVSGGASCPYATSEAFLLGTALKITSDSSYVDNTRDTIHIAEALNRNTVYNTLLKDTLKKIQALINKKCNVNTNLQSDLYSAKAPTGKDSRKVLSNAQLLDTSMTQIQQFESSVGTLLTDITNFDDLALGIKALSKIIAFLGLTDFYDEILTVLSSSDFVDILTNIGTALRSGEGIVGAVDALIQTLLSADFFKALSSLLTIQDLGTILSSLLTLVVALLVDVLLIVEALLLLLAQLVAELIPILQGLLLP